MTAFPVHESDGIPVVRRSRDTLLLRVEPSDYPAYLKLPSAVTCGGKTYRRVRWSGQTGLVVYRLSEVARAVQAA